MKRVLTLFVALLIPARCAVAADPCARIVSLSPSVTEVVFELGLGDRLVGVTRYCRYPPEAAKIPTVGGFYDVSLEHIIGVRPTYIFGLRENAAILSSAGRFDISTQEVDHTTTDGIKESLLTIARVCGIQKVGESRVAELEREEHELRVRMEGAPVYKTLVVVGRTHEGSTVSSLYVSGKDGFYSGVLGILGLQNVNQDATISIPTLSPEGLLTLAPDVIVEIVAPDDSKRSDDTARLWQRYEKIPAVRYGRVFTLTNDYASIPGPRYIRVARDLADKLQPKRGV